MMRVLCVLLRLGLILSEPVAIISSHHASL